MKSLLRRLLWFACAGLLLLPGTAPAAAGCTVEVELDRDTCTIGDWLRLRITTTATEEYQPLWPDWSGRKLGSFQVLADSQTAADRQELTLAVYELGRQVVPAFPFPFLDRRDSTVFTLQTDSLAVLVNTVRDSVAQTAAPRDSAVAELLDIYPPQERPLSWRDLTRYALWAAGVILLVWLGVLLLRKLLRRGQPALPLLPVETRPPWERALEQLYAVREAKLWQRGEVIEHYFRISLVVRRYLEWMTGVAVAEMTTGEIERLLVEHLPAEQLHSRLLTQLRRADLVKFAGQLPPEQQHDAYWEEATTLLGDWRDWFAQNQNAAAEKVEEMA